MSKYCNICSNKCGVFTRHTLKNGLICNNCKAKLSYWFLQSEVLREYTIAEIKEQLHSREENKRLVYQFHPTQQLQLDDKTFLKVDDNAEKFMIVDQRYDSNPDVLDLSRFISCEVADEENITKCSERDGGGYSTTCTLGIIIKVDAPYFKLINLKNMTRSIGTRLDSFLDTWEFDDDEYYDYCKFRRDARYELNATAEAINHIFRNYHEKQEEKRKRLEESRKRQADEKRKSAILERIEDISRQVDNSFCEQKLLQVSELSAKDKVEEYGRLRKFCYSYIPELRNKQAEIASEFTQEFQEYVDISMCRIFDCNWAALSKAFFTLRRGIHGEDKVEEVLSLYDDRICFIRDYTWFYEHDFVVFAPSGIYTIEVKMLSSDYVLTETGVLKPLKDCNKMTMNVVLQSRKHVETLRKGLKECAAFTSEIPITEIICCADEKHIIKNEFPDIDVCYCNTLNKFIFPNNVESKLTAEKMAELKDFLLQRGEKNPHIYAVFGDQGDLPSKEEFVQSFAYTVGAKYVQEHFESF